ncbi:molybdate ABC transporter substrate-binding protein [Roseivirga sp. 4D4]|uniref:molybdate ABC transporter substrate-binding protein n=1 Tax=Roseivirga sp. 4D4 TaxID=1889784 RepID=UPI0008534A47|nr:molybdate ABC transporter substrate-binding protein [Roseivirga sp. 4D4]OEK00783.1 molybdate ABC transporter substrate-binding protein [Roseivirga sp. 4D4]
MKRQWTILLLLVLCLSCSNQNSSKLTIAAAANMQFAVEQLEEAYESETGEDIEVILASSGKLTNQIIAGAPYDLLLSADSLYPQTLLQEGFAYDLPVTYAYGKLVLWTSVDSLQVASGAIGLKEMKFAMANPKTAPYGRATVEFLKSVGDWELFQEKLVYGESISQVNQFLLSGAAPAGFTSKSSILSEAFSDKGSWIDVPTGTYTPIAQQMVILNARSEMLNQAKSFFDFILSARGQKILADFGYTPYP